MGWLGAPNSATAGASLISPGKAVILEPGARLKLRLRDQSRVEGRYLGRALLDSALYATRFAEHMLASSFAPLALGETLQITLRDGRDRTAAFAGYGDRSLFMSGSPGTEPVRVPIESIDGIRHANDREVDLKVLSRELKRDALPSAEALVIEDLKALGDPNERWSKAERIPVSEIEWASLAIGDDKKGSSLAGGIILGALAGAVIAILVIAYAIDSAFDDCGSAVGSMALPPLSGLTLTTRPFDLDRGCYEGEPLAECGLWPERVDIGPSTAAAVP